MLNRRPAHPFAALAVVALLVAGCGRMAPTRPDTGLDSSPSGSRAASGYAAMPTVLPVTLPGPEAAPTPGVVGLRVVNNPFIVSTNSRKGLPGVLRFVLATVLHVLPGAESTVSAGPWQLQFHAGSLTTAKDVTIALARNGPMIVQFGPDGTVFGTPVDLAIDYTGTALDPSSNRYVKGLVPQFLYYDPALRAWVELPCTVDAANRKVHAKLQHFSTYGLGGRAGW